MRRRLRKWLRSYFVRYIPSGKDNIINEAKRLSIFICENYTNYQQLIILESMKENIIAFKEDEIVKTEENIQNQTNQLVNLKDCLQKLKEL